jgi:hypothetical protein
VCDSACGVCVCGMVVRVLRVLGVYLVCVRVCEGVCVRVCVPYVCTCVWMCASEGCAVEGG